MLEFDQNQASITPESAAWQAVHGSSPCMLPAAITLAGEPIISDGSFQFDQLGSRQVLLEKRRCYKKGGGAVVEETGLLPFGQQIRFQQSSRYAAQTLRVTFDLGWPPNTPVERHLGIGSLFLPGTWTGYYCIPPVRHLNEGAIPQTVSIASLEDQAATRMIGHWHRPPLALVLHRSDGVRVELGAGGDIWRWEQSLGAGPESGSYKLVLEKDGVRFIREPLMTCTPFTPQPQSYRFKWYLAWDQGATAAVASESALAQAEHLICFDSLVETGYRLTTADDGILVRETTAPCWLSPVVQREVKRRIRQLAALSGEHTLVVHGLQPGACLDPSHLQRGRRATSLAHWDMDAILETTAWMRRQLGDHWRILAAPCPAAAELPSFSSLFQPGGFE